ncbi:MAG: PAS domain-containing protein [Byssovorax sp.]
MGEPDTAESLHLEIATLRSRTAALQAALRGAEERVERLERTIEVVPGAVWESEGSPGQADYKMPFVSGQVERIFGYTFAECLRHPSFWTSIVHPDDTPIVARELSQVAATGGRLSELRFLTKDGRSVWVETHIALRRDESGAVVGRCVVAPDVTERVLAERARREQLARAEELAARLDNLIAGVPGLVWESRVDPGSPGPAPTFVSDYLLTLVGYRPGEVVGKPWIWNQITHPDDRARVDEETAQIHAGGGGQMQYRVVARDGQIRWVETHLRVIHDEGGAVRRALGVTLDITERRFAEEARAALNDQVIQSQKATLVELQAPLIPISQSVLVMPLIGTLDEARLAHALTALLQGITAAHARIVILDVTGARNVDARIAEALLKSARAAGLLGVEVVVTGISPPAAATLARLGVSFEGLVLHGTLEDGIRHATNRS